MMDNSLFKLESKTVGINVVMTPQVREITFKNTRDFLKEAKRVVADTCDVAKRYVLDLEHIEIIDSVSLGCLVAVFKYAKDNECELVVANAAEPIKDLFELLHFTSVFKIFPTIEDALKD